MAISLKSIIQTVAPTLASALPGPLGGMAKKLIGELVGKPEASEAELTKILATANPDILLKLRELDTNFKQKMAELDVDLEKLAAEDRSNARSMQVATKSKTPAILATIIVGGYIGVQSFLLLHTIPLTNHDLILRAMGLLDGALMLVLGFYFGSSVSSQHKDATISRIAESD